MSQSVWLFEEKSFLIRLGDPVQCQGLLTHILPISGACFATQFHVAYSGIIHGMGSWAGVPNLCYTKDALFCLSTPGIINTESLISDTDQLAAEGKIDPTENMADDM